MMMISCASTPAETKAKPHAVCIACPFQSHITALLSLAKLLHHKGFHITFVNTDYNHNRLLHSRGPSSLDGLPDFRFESIPDGLPPSDSRKDIRRVFKSLKSSLSSQIMDLITQKLMKASDVPPVTCVVADIFMSFTLSVGDKLGVPGVSYCTISACALMAFSQFPALKEKGFIPLKDSNCLTSAYLDTILDWIPGMNNIRIRDMPTSLRTIDPDVWMVDFVIDELQQASKRASAQVINTFDALEEDALKALATSFPHLCTIGPVHLLLNQVPRQSPVMSIGSNLWQEEGECLTWLDSKEPNSVVYVNFGSIVVMSEEQLHEFAWGLADSKCDFLWIVRPGLVIGNESTTLGLEFEEATRERCFITTWCPQMQVLDHPAVSFFLTHNGWNSTLESLSSGVPMICWPFSGDQMMNCRYSCVEWGIGEEIREVKRDDVSRLVRDLVVGEEGRKMKERVMEWKNSAHAAVAPKGSSSMNLERLVKTIVSNVRSH